jgi:putative spermidine/putrescine transport system ATP-binding protein
MTPAVEFDGVSRHFGGVRAVDGVDLAIGEGSFFAMLGPSGSGKTTCLRLISGFETPSAGHVRLFGTAAEHLPPNRRSVNTVFQDYALFPHLNVRDNVGYGLMVKGVPRAARQAQAEEMLTLVRLEGFGARKPSQLSGGQRQRVALARALLRGRPLLLMDEPFAALGPALRAEMLELVTRIRAEHGTTLIVATHQPEDARRIAGLTVIVDGQRAFPPRATESVFADPPPELRAYLG